MKAVSPAALRDIEDRDDLEQVVRAFYGQVKEDGLLGHLFTDVAKVDWEHHLPKMVDFWETMLFRSGSYRGNPLRPHLDLATKVPITGAHFERWLERFFGTVDQLYQGEKAEHLKRAAADMARVMQSRLTGEPIPMSFGPGAPRPD